MQSETRLVSCIDRDWKAWSGCYLWAFPDGFAPGRPVKIVYLLNTQADQPIISAQYRDMALAARIG